MTKLLIDRETLEQVLDAMQRGFWTGLEHRRYLDAMAAIQALLNAPSEPDEYRCGGEGCDGKCCVRYAPSDHDDACAEQGKVGNPCARAVQNL